jgi:hypothetical protein
VAQGIADGLGESGFGRDAAELSLEPRLHGVKRSTLRLTNAGALIGRAVVDDTISAISR